MQNKIFTFDQIIVFFKHTDYYGDVHPYNYMEWMSYAREAFFQGLVTNFMEVCNRNIKMVTTFVEFRLLADAKFGDKIKIQIFSTRVKKISFNVIFEISLLENGKMLSAGTQKLTFLNAETGRPAPIPEELKKAVLEFEHKSNVDSTISQNQK